MKFISKRNQVSLENGVVVKYYANKKALRQEAEALQYLQSMGIAVPMLLSTHKNCLKMKYIEGETYLEHVDRMTLEKAKALAKWLFDYYLVMGRVKGDVNLRNFIWSDKACLGLDFEDPPLPGSLELCFGKVLAFAITYQPAFDLAKARCAEFLLQAFLELETEPEKIKSAYLQEVNAMNLRRASSLIRIEDATLFFNEVLQQVINNNREVT